MALSQSKGYRNSVKVNVMGSVTDLHTNNMQLLTKMEQ